MDVPSGSCFREFPSDDKSHQRYGKTEQSAREDKVGTGAL